MSVNVAVFISDHVSDMIVRTFGNEYILQIKCVLTICLLYFIFGYVMNSYRIFFIHSRWGDHTIVIKL